MLRRLLPAILLIGLAGCKLVIQVPVGGHVTTASGAYSCGAGETCEISIDDVNFAEHFSGVADAGYVFLGWKAVTRGLCGDYYSSCYVSPLRFGDFPAVHELVASDEVFYLVPEFVQGTPMPEALQRVEDPHFRECIRTWSRNETLEYAEQVVDIRCIDDREEIESAEGLQAFVAVRTLMLNAWKYSLEPLAGLRRLEFLRLRLHPDADLAPLAGLENLNRLEYGVFQPSTNCAEYAGTAWACQSVGLRNTRAIGGLHKLTFVNLYGEMNNLAPFSTLRKLETLYVTSGSWVKSLKPLEGLRRLRNVAMPGHPISDISPLQNARQLERLELNDAQVRDISPLKGKNNLRLLALNNNRVSDLSPLRGAPLAGLYLDNNRITDISPLSKLVPPGPAPNNHLTLFLRNNNIKRIGNAFQSIEKGEILLDGNPLACSELEAYVATKPSFVEVHSDACN